MGLSLAHSRIYRQIEREAKLNPITFAHCRYDSRHSKLQNVKRLTKIRTALKQNAESIKVWSLGKREDPDAIMVGRSYYEQTQALIIQVGKLIENIDLREKD